MLPTLFLNELKWKFRGKILNGFEISWSLALYKEQATDSKPGIEDEHKYIKTNPTG